jgi:hypothetical protein
MSDGGLTYIGKKIIKKDIKMTGEMTATSFVGNGSGLTGIQALGTLGAFELIDEELVPRADATIVDVIFETDSNDDLVIRSDYWG